MPLDKRCSQAAVDANFSRLYKEGKRNPQLSAIVLSVLKKSCGVPDDTQMSIKQVLGAKAEGCGCGRRWVELESLFMEGGSSGQVLYHIGKRPPIPQLKRHDGGKGEKGGGWERPWLDKPTGKVVFLTSNPVGVAVHHGVTSGNVYAFDVPNWVIKQAGGIHRYERGSEVLIPEELWQHVKFKGKVMDQKTLLAKVRPQFSARGKEAHTGSVIADRRDAAEFEKKVRKRETMAMKRERLEREAQAAKRKARAQDILRRSGVSDVLEDLPSSPAVRGLSFDLPGGMKGVGTSPAAAPPDETRGLAGRLAPPIPIEKCPRCGRAYNKAQGRCRCGMREAVNLAGGMRMDPLVGASPLVACENCGGAVRRGARCSRCGVEA